MQTEQLVVDRSRLRWLCRRGRKELDVLFEDFLSRRYDCVPLAQQAAFVRLLEWQDPEIWSLLLGETQAPDPELQSLIEIIRSRD